MPPLYDQPSTAYDDELAAQAEELAIKKERLKRQVAQSAESIGIFAPGGGVSVNQPQGFRSAVTGAEFLAPTVARPKWAAAIPAIADYSLDRTVSDMARATGDLNYRTRVDAQRRMDDMPQTIPAQAAQDAVPDIPGNPAQPVRLGAYGVPEAEILGAYGVPVPGIGTPATPDIPGTPAQPARDAVEPSLRDRLKWAFGLSGNSITAPLGSAYATDILTKEPDRREAREDRLTIAREASETKREIARGAQQTSRDNAALLASTRDSGAKGNWHDMGPATDGSGLNLWYNPTLPEGQNRKLGPPTPPTADERKERRSADAQYRRSGDVLSIGEQIKPLIEKSTGSAPFRGWDAVNRFFGNTTEGAAAIAALQPYAAQLTQSVPRFEGPQSNTDVQSYKDAAADIANPDKTTGERWAGYQTMFRLHEKARQQHEDMYGLPSTASPASSPGTPPKYPGNAASGKVSGPTPDTGVKVVVPIKSDADWLKLPRGTRFVGPDGKERVK